jgi:hypothetical protein
VLPENQKICIKVEANALPKVYAIFRLASVQSSSVALNENGTVGSVQQIDLTA